MPLIIITGFPASGKSTTAREIERYFRELISSSPTGDVLSSAECAKNFIRRIHVVSDSDHIRAMGGRDKVFNDSILEKELRSNLKSASMRHLSPESLVILDAANYIKGYRYELYCAAKEYKSTHCVVERIISIEDAWRLNEGRMSARTDDLVDSYSRDTFDALIRRYESPDSRNRWDSPLICCSSGPTLSDGDFSQIRDALFLRTPSKPNLCTVTQPLTGSDYLFKLDSATQAVSKRVLNAQQAPDFCVGAPMKIPESSETLSLPRRLTAGELNRLRRRFVSYSKLHPVSEADMVRNFIHYLNNTT